MTPTSASRHSVTQTFRTNPGAGAPAELNSTARDHASARSSTNGGPVTCSTRRFGISS